MRAIDQIPAEDLKIESSDPRPVGGQHFGTGPSGVKITHIPTGTEAICRSSRSQHLNREIAMDMILAALTHPRF